MVDSLHEPIPRQAPRSSEAGCEPAGAGTKRAPLEAPFPNVQSVALLEVLLDAKTHEIAPSLWLKPVTHYEMRATLNRSAQVFSTSSPKLVHLQEILSRCPLAQGTTSRE